MIADLHVHSHYSDGADRVEEVLRQAKANGVAQISFVDHDTVAGLDEKLTLGEAFGIEVIPGIEISAYDFKRHRKVHILGYDFLHEAPAIRALCAPLLARRHIHSLHQLKQLQKAGFQLSEEKAAESAKPSLSVYKQHLMAQLIDAPYESADYQTLYRSLFKAGGPAAGDIRYVDAADAVEAIKKDGGIAVVAHPGQLDSYDLIPELVAAGLDGIERHHPDHTTEDHQRVDALLARYGLGATGGTDYHGRFGAPVKPGEIASPSLFEAAFKHVKTV